MFLKPNSLQRATVARGAAELDRYLPGWQDSITSPILLWDGNRCILGQLARRDERVKNYPGSYRRSFYGEDDFIDALRYLNSAIYKDRCQFDLVTLASHGFITVGEGLLDHQRTVNAWKAEIKARRRIAKAKRRLPVVEQYELTA